MMITDMLVYLAWILFTIGIVAFVYHILRLDRPHQVTVSTGKHDKGD